MTRLSGPLQDLRQARSSLSRSWERTEARWTDSRAREYESRYQIPLDRASLSFERALAGLDGELDKAMRNLPD